MLLSSLHWHLELGFGSCPFRSSLECCLLLGSTEESLILVKYTQSLDFKTLLLKHFFCLFANSNQAARELTLTVVMYSYSFPTKPFLCFPTPGGVSTLCRVGCKASKNGIIYPCSGLARWVTDRVFDLFIHTGDQPSSTNTFSACCKVIEIK